VKNNMANPESRPFIRKAIVNKNVKQPFGGSCGGSCAGGECGGSCAGSCSGGECSSTCGSTTCNYKPESRRPR